MIGSRALDAPAARELRRRLAALFDQAGVEGFLFACDIDSGLSAGYREQEPVLLASCRKVGLLLELVRGMDAGEWDPLERLRVRAPLPPPVGYGIAQLRDEVEISLRD